jgi:trigger factor
VLDAVVERAEVDVPGELAHARAHEMWDQMSRTMARQGIDKETYLRISGKESEEDLVHEAIPDAVQALKREAVLAAVVEAEGIDPTEEEILHELEHPAEHEGVKVEKLFERLRSAHRLDQFKAEVATNRAAELLAEEAKPVAKPAEEPAETGEVESDA